MNKLFSVIAIWIGGLLIGSGIVLIYSFNQPQLKPAYVIKEEYATTKVTTKLYDVKEQKFAEAKEWWEQNGYVAEAHLGPLDWHSNQIPKKMEMIFNGIEPGWTVAVYEQTPDTEFPPCHFYIGNKPTNSFVLELSYPDRVYKWKVGFYRISKDADPNFYPNRSVTVDFVWKVNKLKPSLIK